MDADPALRRGRPEADPEEPAAASAASIAADTVGSATARENLNLTEWVASYFPSRSRYKGSRALRIAGGEVGDYGGCGARKGSEREGL